jgi:hypothetical protein
MFEKNGMLTEDSQSDYSMHKKAEFYDADGPTVADRDNRHKLNKPRRISWVKAEEITDGC